jgi:hypothetical protein
MFGLEQEDPPGTDLRRTLESASVSVQTTSARANIWFISAVLQHDNWNVTHQKTTFLSNSSISVEIASEGA